MTMSVGIMVGFIAWFIVRYSAGRLCTVDQKRTGGQDRARRAQRLGDETTLDDPISQGLRPDERERYRYPQLRVIPPGGPYVKWPWERVHKVFDRHAHASTWPTTGDAARQTTAARFSRPSPKTNSTPA